MLPRFYQAHLQTQLSPSQYVLLNILIELLQWQKQVRLERLASNLPLPIQFESRRRQLQRFLVCPQLTIQSLWFANIKHLLTSYFSSSKELMIVLDRTQWREQNLLMVSLIWHRRAVPLYWQFLPHKGSSSFTEQRAIVQTILPLLKNYQVTVLGDREFCSVELGQWLGNQDLLLCLRLRRNEYIHSAHEITRQLSQVGLAPGTSVFFEGVNVTRQQGFGSFNVACKWKRNYRKKVLSEGWFLLTNMPTLQAATTAYQQRSGIEAMFKDCKSGGYSLEGCHANEQRLCAIVLLIALAYSSAIIQGLEIQTLQVEHYVCRPKEPSRTCRRHSHFWAGLYGQTWLSTLDLCANWVAQWICFNRNKRLYYQRGLRAIALMQPEL